MRKLVSVATALFLASAAAQAATSEWQPLPEKPPEPADNPSTPAKAVLGKMLYFDPRFTATGTGSCNSCHNLMLGGDDSRALSMGVHGKLGARSAPTVWNAAFHSVQFWDGRAPTLEEQARGPVTNPVEMAMTSWEDVMARLNAIPEYKRLFEAAFGSDNPINADNAVRAIAAFERTLITPNSPYDKYARGNPQALSEQQIRGLNTFAQVGCVNCHSGPAFNGPQLPLGTGFFMKFPTYENAELDTRYGFTKDLGRYEVTKKEEDKHMFRVPTLRNIAMTAPYFHNGAVKTLDEAIRVMAKVQLNKDLTQQQVDDIFAFLTGLTGEFPKIEIPRLPVAPGKSFSFQ
jgi:cytochrome c peroxidase